MRERSRQENSPLHLAVQCRGERERERECSAFPDETWCPDGLLKERTRPDRLPGQKLRPGNGPNNPTNDLEGTDKGFVDGEDMIR